MVAMGDLLYVADTENHAIRVVDRKARTVTTVAGTGALGLGRLRDEEAPAKTTALRSPWDLAVVGNTLYVALAGSHQIAIVDPKASTVRLFAGTGQEYLSDGARLKATFAQPSGLATDGKDLFVLDSETSSLRKIELASGQVTTLVGHGLFVFGDTDGPGDKARLQHPIGLTYGSGSLYIADTYNSKLKRVDPATGTVKTVVGGKDHAAFFEPAGLAFVGPSLWIADTNHDRIVKTDPASGSVTPITLAGLTTPKP
jgi:sugar lactone lactonase YvrE